MTGIKKDSKKFLGILTLMMAFGMALPAAAYENHYYYDSVRPSSTSYGYYSGGYVEAYVPAGYTYGYGYERYADPAKKRLYGGGQIIRQGEYCPGSMGFIYSPWSRSISYTCY